MSGKETDAEQSLVSRIQNSRPRDAFKRLKQIGAKRNYIANVGDYLRKREHQQTQLLYSKLAELDEYMQMNHAQYNQDHIDQVSRVQQGLAANSPHLRQFYSECYGIDSSYVDKVVLASVNEKLDYLRLHLTHFVENELDVSLHFSNIAVS